MSVTVASPTPMTGIEDDSTTVTSSEGRQARSARAVRYPAVPPPMTPTVRIAAGSSAAGSCAGGLTGSWCTESSRGSRLPPAPIQDVSASPSSGLRAAMSGSKMDDLDMSVPLFLSFQLRAVRLGHPRHLVEDVGPQLPSGDPRPTSAVDRVTEAEVNRVHDGADQVPVVEHEHRNDGLPVLAVRAEQCRAVLAARREVPGRRGTVGRRHLGVVLGRDELAELDLADDVAEAVKDRLPLVDLNAAQEVGAMPDHRVRAALDRLVRECPQELPRFLGGQTRLVGMHAHDDRVGPLPCVPDPGCNVGHGPRLAPGLPARLGAHLEQSAK